jgi:purine-binding chemotaxis protein CheW
MGVQSNGMDGNGTRALRIEEATKRDAGEEGPDLPDRSAIFDLRAERLARLQEPRAGDTSGNAAEIVLIFALGEERYAFPGEQVREVRPLGQITPLPGTPAFVAGLMNVRGRIVPVIDLCAFFDLVRPTRPGEQADDDRAMVLIIESPHGEVGLLTTGRPQVRAMEHTSASADSNDLQTRPAALPAGLRTEYVRGVTADLVILLDAAGLLADQRLILKMEP